MGASESTAISNGTNDKEEEEGTTSSGGTSIAAAATVAAGVVAVGWSISEMLSDNMVNSPRTINQRSIWSPPSRGRFKMNTDGACHPKSVEVAYGVERGPSGYGGILRDHHGKWVRGFYGFIGKTNCLTSELHGILKGLELLVELNLKGAILETDCEAAQQLVTRQGECRGKTSIIEKCRELIDENDIEVTLIRREANQCANELANMAIDRREAYVEIKDLPYELRNLVEKGSSSINEAKNQRGMWSPPPRGRFKMNTDGGCHPESVAASGVQRGPSGYGGILRDENGEWVRGFLGFVGEADCLTSELHGIRKGLVLLVKLNLKGAILETDSQAAYQWVTRQGDYRGKSSIIDASWFIIQKCRQLIDENDIVISLIHGEANKCADKLANMAIERREAYVEIKDLPHELMNILGKDAEFNG